MTTKMNKLMGTNTKDIMNKEKPNQAVGRYLPPLTSVEYQALRADIEANGVLVPVVVDEYGNVIDGFNRTEIAADLGIKDYPTRLVSGLTEEEKRHMALGLNANRRSLTTQQKRHLIQEELKRSPDLSNNWLAEIVGVSDKTVESVRRELEKAGTIPTITEFRCKDGKRRKYRTVTVEKAEEAVQAQSALQVLGYDAPEKPLALKRALRLARRKESQVRAQQTDLVIPQPEDAVQLYHRDFRQLDLKPETAKLVFTDPPYQPEALPLWEDLAAFASRVLMPGGLLLTYAGTYNLPEVLERLGRHLRFQWVFAVLNGGDSPLFYSRNIQVAWKPLLLFTKGEYIPQRQLRDVLQGTGKDKSYHVWQQNLDEAMYFVERLTRPADLVVDPFGGSFTTAVACKRLGRRCISCDIEKECVVTGLERLRAEANGTQAA